MESIFDNDSPNGNDADSRKPRVEAVNEPPPRRGRPPGSVNKTSVKKIEDSLNAMLVGPALGLQAIGDNTCAWVLVGEGSPGRQMTASWAELAKQSPAVRKALEKMITGGAIGGVIMSTATVILLIGAHHNVWPVERLNEGGQAMTMLMYTQAMNGDGDGA